MADDDWKKRVGIQINFTSDSEDEGVNNLQEERKKNDDDQFPTRIKSSEFSIEGNRFLDDHILNEYAEYGTTPPRTRISRRQKERKQRERSDTSDIKVSSSIKTKRRNTLDSIYFNEILERCEDGNISSQEYEQLNRVDTTRRSKRSIKIIRGSERDMKLDHASARHSMPPTMEHVDDRAESMPIQTPQAIKIETCNRFLSLTSKLVACSKLMHKEDKPKIDYPQNRVEFYNTFSLLIRMGSSENKGDKNPRRQLSKEEHLWQNELKDIIWLELQAWHADRTSTEQDEYLCAARESVGTLLDNIMNYRFTRSPIQESYPLHSGRVSTQSSDSGISVDGKLSAPSTPKITTCVGCLSIYCQICKENQNAALKDVEELLNRLEAAESLYPSSKAFGVHYPLYKSSIFVGRVKAMCLWYNMTKHHRLMMMILGKLLMLLQSKNCHWPQVGDEDTSGIATDASVSEDQGISSRRTSVEGKPFTKLQSRVVQFEMDSSSPSDSNNSNASSHGTGELSETISEVDYYNPANISKLQTVLCHSTKPSPISPYRKYIEDMLKTKGLRKSLNFLEKLHRYVLIKATATLRKPKEQDTLTEESSSIPPEKNIEFVSSVKDLPNRTSFYSNSMDLAEDEEEELVRYGYWSVEAQDLHLPSYRSAFLFLSRIPLEVIHEFLRMRLEQKPEEPSVLCIRQLMRELKEGLRIAVLHKQRYLCLLQTTLWDVEKQTLESFQEGITEFDSSMKTVLELYLEYLQKWVPQVHQERFQKNILEEEWLFVKKTCPNIPGGEGLAANSFCRIASGMLEEIGRYLTSGVKELTKNLYNGDLSQEDFSIKQVVLSVCREFQFLYNEARERALKALAFAKTLRKDLECGTFVLKNQPSCSVIIAGSLQELKTEALTLCHDITSTIRTLEDTYNLHELGDLDDCDKIQLLNRCREILHLGYKFGFEYHKEVCRLVTGDARAKLSHGLISFAQQWMKFVKERCERGRGLRPRWANQGLDFLMTVCEPENTLFLSNSEFEELKRSIDECISHVIGTAVPVHDKCVTGHSSHLNHTPRGSLDGQYPRSRGSSPVSRTKSPSYRSSRSMQDASNSPSFPPAQRSFSAMGSSISIDESDNIVDGAVAEVLFVPPKGASRIQRVFAAVRKLDSKLEEKLRNKELIGSVTDVECEDKIHIKSRSVTFSWQRGIKIGQGRFGKVYTAVNNQTGELMAMKEIQLQPNDHRTIRRVAEELKTFEGIHHEALVRYYGVEIHREEMLIFMEFCTEGTLESLVAATESGLPEVLMRRYTHQLLEAVVTLHNYGIVHRDIKSANIFLTDKGNSLKLGDFGSAVKIKAHTTMPGELQGFVGTQAYMAPEVFMNSEGHGRGADVWSLGCVILEMASGERPWAEFDSNYQIMFKVGMGETPSVPDSLSDEGHQFVDLCLQHDPKKRAAAQDLLHHTFVKVDIDDDHISSIPSIFEESLKIIKR